MIKKLLDVHGFTVEEALQVLEDELFQAYKNKKEIELTFCTGRGAIRNTLIAEFENYELDFIIDSSNEGLLKIYLN